MSLALLIVIERFLLMSNFASADGAPIYGMVPCIIADNEGAIHKTEGLKGCTIKSQKRLKDGEVVTYETQQPFFLGPNQPPKVRTITKTMVTKTQNGKLVETTEIDGEYTPKAGKTFTTEINTGSQRYENQATQRYVTLRDNTKGEQKLVIFDKTFCDQLQGLGAPLETSVMIQRCSNMLSKYEDAANLLKARLAKEGKKPGLWEPTTDKGVSYREAIIGNFSDLSRMITACHPLVAGPVPLPFSSAPPQPFTPTDEWKQRVKDKKDTKGTQEGTPADI